MIRFVLFVILSSSVTAAAQSGTGMPFLVIGADPVQLASAETMAANGTGPATLFSNPALMGFETASTVSLSNTFWLDDAYNRSASWVHPGRNWTFGAGVLQSTVGDLEARLAPGPPAGTFSVSYLAFTGGLARRFGHVSIGAHGSYLYERVFDRSATGYRVGGGLAGRFLDNRLRVGSVVTNFGSMEILTLESTPLPRIWRSGFAADVLQFSVNQVRNVPLLVSVAADAHVPFDDPAYLSATLALTASDVLVLRGGYRSGETNRPLSWGLELIQPRFRLSYALVPFESGFGSSHSIGVTFGI